MESTDTDSNMSNTEALVASLTKDLEFGSLVVWMVAQEMGKEEDLVKYDFEALLVILAVRYLFFIYFAFIHLLNLIIGRNVLKKIQH